jgi:phosphofructokinase-like protein
VQAKPLSEESDVQRAGVLTGGGDSPGINAAIRSIVRFGYKHDIEALGFLNGWQGLLEKLMRPLGLDDVRGILHTGGTILGSSRSNPFRVENGVEKLQATLKQNKINFIIAIGGDDTLGVAHRLSEHGVKAVGIPQTIDNDIPKTDYAIGFASALEAITDALDRLHTTACSHHRVLILEVMGRDSGWLSLMGGIAGGADVILLPEKNFSLEDIERSIKARQARGTDFSVVIVAEGAKPVGLGGQVIAEEETDAFGHVRLGGVGQYLANQLSKCLTIPVRVTNLAYIQRGGCPCPFDRILATRFGVAAIDFALEGHFDVMTALHGMEIEPVPLAEVAGTPRSLDPRFLHLADLFD